MLLRTLTFLPAAMSRRVETLLEAEPVRCSAGSRSIRASLRGVPVDLVLVHEARLGADAEALVAELGRDEGPDVIVFVAQEEPTLRARWIAAGALAVLNTSLDDSALGEALHTVVARCRAAATQRLRVERGEPRASLADFVSHSDEIRRLVVVARRMVDSDATLLVSGETGVGKERLARAIHDEGPRRSGPFVAINCGALPEALLESELFGHEEGAFTGAVRAHRGLFELAHGGTLFLDEVGELPLLLQVKLLRTLQDHRVRPVGSERDLLVDVRVIAATNRDLLAEMRAGRFRADLYYRLAVVAVTIPPLRERRADIPVLAGNHVESICVRLNRRPVTIEDDAMLALVAHDWPGNVRELANVLERAVLLGDGVRVRRQDLTGIAASSGGETGRGLSAELEAMPHAAALAAVTDDFERRYFTALLTACRGHLGEVARRAGVSPRTVFSKLERLGLRKEQFRGVVGGAP
ncbi:MAG: sigma-54-dependent Fis family transcriptional regulator [Planctomycetes bacterium]|nr:sigma-54-dependent Fis family transcriptional regulator [Planctomycetota bacterium]